MNAMQKGPARRRGGFTLMEILVVVMIISILATIVGVQVIPRLGEAKQSAARAQMAAFEQALGVYRLHHGRYPTREQGLAALCRKPTVPPIPENYPAEGYLDSSEVPLDPWGRAYVYFIPGSDGRPYEIVSYGADGEPGGEGENAEVSSAD